MIYKYLIKGAGEQGHVTSEYGSSGGKSFQHKAFEVTEPPF
jgi:hypothetical protein